MARFYEMPAVSPTMEVGQIVAWKLAEGQAFEPQAVVAEVATDKANMEAEIFESGVLIKQLVAEGDEVPAGFPIAIFGKSRDEDIAALLAEFEVRKSARAAAPAAAQPADGGNGTEPGKAGGQAPRGDAPPQPAAAAERPARNAPRAKEWMGRKLGNNVLEPPGDARVGLTPARIVASPLAKKVAEDKGIDLRRVKGSGPGGRIVRADVEEAPARGRTPVPRADEVVRHTPMRKTIARRLLASHQDIPTFFLTASFDVHGLVELREALKKLEIKVSYNDLLVMCVARALREFPRANASWRDTDIVRHGRVDVGIAVAMPDGLVTPVLRGADALSVTEISERTKDLAARGRAGKLAQEEYTGATFTISNLGMFDISHFTAIINPPEAAILAVGSVAQVPVVHSGALAVGWRTNVTMTCDHRVIDGATGAEFLQVLRRYVECPALLGVL